ncbi:MAG: carbamoyltransferase N-terminal domain-containing protein, partial [Thermodesulfobacteriota bacterium]|nr:carbamoyltransferase N-terminal domain-containing protein [Thermodesulfobacteriota bacterium]
MKILAICDSHEAAASVMVDGEIICAAAEERFSRLKADLGFPPKAIDFCLRFTGLRGKDFDVIVLPSKFLNYNITRFKRETLFTTDDWLKEMYQYWEPKLYHGETPDYVEIFRDDPRFKDTSPYDFEKVKNSEGDLHDNFFKERVRVISEYLDVPAEKISHVTHEHAHAYYAYFG